MRKALLVLMMITAVFLIVGCQAEAVPDSCTATLNDIMADSPFMDITGVMMEEMEAIPVLGGEADQVISLNEETLVLVQFPSSEEAAEQLAPAVLEETFAGLGTVIEDSPIVFGDETTLVHLESDAASEVMVARYGDRLAVGQAVFEAGMQEILGGFDVALLAYIGEHPECAYLHPQTR